MKRYSISSEDFGLSLKKESIEKILEKKYLSLLHEFLPDLRDKFKPGYLSERIRSAKSGVLYSMYGEDLAGFFSFLDEGKPKTVYAWIAVLKPKYRNRGLTKRVLEEVSKEFKEQGYELLEVKTSRKNNPAIVNLLKSGFYLNLIEGDLVYLSKSL